MYKAPVCNISSLQKDFEKNLAVILKEEKKRYPLSPSTAMNCYRKLSYELINWEKPGSIGSVPMGGRKLLVFARGHMVEKMMGEWLAKVPGVEVIICKERFPIHDNEETGLKIDGEIDMFIKQNGKLKLLDVKDTNTQTFQSIAYEGGKEQNRPKFSNYIQQQLYLHSKFCKDKGVNEGILLYENKDTQETHFLEFPYDENIALWAIKRLENIYANRGHVLPREFLFGSDWNCRPQYCEFHDYCYAPLETKRNKPVVLTDEAIEVIDNYLGAAKTTKDDDMRVIYALFQRGDSHEYHYKGKTFTIKKLKTTLSLDVT